MENAHYDKREIHQKLLQASREGALLEIGIGSGKSRERFGARLLPYPEDETVEGKDMAAETIIQQSQQLRRELALQENREFEEEVAESSVPAYMLITPLEPTVGNIKIRKVPQVGVRFYLGVEAYEANAMFQKVLMVGGGQAIQLSMPSVLHFKPRRLQARVDVPAGVDLKVMVQKRGNDGFSADLVDISPGGLSFTLGDGVGVILEKGDKVGVAIHGSMLQGTPVSTFGSVCYIARARERGNFQVACLQYGVQFKLLSVADSMTVDRLVRELQKKPRYKK